MAIAKHLIRTGVGIGAAVLGAGALIYEGALNTKLNAFFVSKFDHPEPEQEALYGGSVYADAQAWFDAHKGEDHTITTEKTGVTHAYLIPAETPSHKWAVLCHGYNSTPKGTSAFALHYHDCGYNCVVPSMRAWGCDENRYCSMGSRDKEICAAWVDYVVAMDPASQIVLHGYSMGGATVLLTAGRPLPENVKAVVSDCSFTTCYEQFKHVLRSYVGLPPFPLLNAVNLVSVVRGNFNIRKNSPIEAVRRSVTPTVFLHGTADDFVPFYMMDELYAACAAPEKAKQEIPGAFHATAVLKDSALYWKTVDGFLKDKIV